MGVPGNANALLLRSAAAAGGYQVSRSLRFNSADSAGLSRSVSTPSSTTTGTFSFWVKRSSIPSSGAYGQTIFGGHSSRNCTIEFDDGGYDKRNSFRIVDESSSPGTYICQLATDQVFRDPSAWYHIVLALDSTQATSTNRIKMYVNGTQVTTFTGAQYYPNQNASFSCLVSSTKYIGSRGAYSDQYFNGYLAEFHFIDGLALAASDFGQTDSTTGQWIPKQFSGSYGSQGWKLDFSDNSNNTASTLGKDTSGNGNNWTPNNLSVTAGAGNDSLVDVPTNGSQTDTGVGGEVRGNYATLSPLHTTGTNSGGGLATLTNGNLDAQSTVAGYRNSFGTIAFPASGKYYFEATLTTVNGANNQSVGIASVSDTSKFFILDCFPGTTNTARKGSDGSYSGSYSTVGQGTVIGVAVDCDNGKAYLAFGNTWIDSSSPTGNTGGYSMASGQFYAPFFSGYNSGITSFNFGQRQFAYTSPAGFKALCTANLPAPVVTKPSTVMDVLAYSGSGSSRTFTGFGFGPDLVWIKQRSGANNHRLYDAVRGATKALYSNLTNSEGTDSTGLTSFTSDGFTLGDGDVVWNASGQTYAAWCWDAGSSTVTNTQGSITSSVRANATAGFSITTLTTPSSGTFTFGHGLGIAPSLLICKSRTSAYSWPVYHRSTGAGVYLYLNSTAATASSNIWQSTNPTSTLIYGDSSNWGTSEPYVVYAFAPVVGYSSFGSYTGNGSSTDGPFVYTGFRARYLLIKTTANISGNWYILDTARDTVNVMPLDLYANDPAAESTVTTNQLDILSNGFKLRGTGGGMNGSGHTLIYAAFAESPFNYARAR